MTNVVSMSGKAPPAALGEPRQDLIELLEDLLASAKSGMLQNLVATGFDKDGSRWAAWCTDPNTCYPMMGALTWLQLEYAERCRQ